MIKKLAHYIGEYKKDAVQAPLFISLEVLMEILIPIVMAMIIDNGLEKGDVGYVVKVGCLIFVMALFSMFFGVKAGQTAAKSSSGFAKNLRKALFERIQDFSFSNIDRFSTASLVTRLTTDVTRLQNAFQMIVRMTFRAPLTIIFSFIMAFMISPKLSMVFLLVIPFLAGTLCFIMVKTFPKFKEMFKKYDVLNRVVQENLSSIRVVKAYVREDHEIEKFENATEELADYSIKAEKMLSLSSPVMQTSMYFCIIAIAWMGASMIVDGSLTTGQFMSLFTYIMSILSSLMMLSMVFVMITMSQASAKRVLEVLEEELDLTNPEHPIMEVKDGSIEFDHVSFSYFKDKEKLHLSDVSFKIQSGQTVGILGGTGSSKSTLVQLIARLYDVTEGSVKVGNEDVRNYDIETLREEVAMVLQKNVLFSGTIKENLRWGNPNASEEELVRVCKLAQADEFIQSFPDKYDTYIEQGGTNVSGGQKQRLCIARALLKKPKILILDDSTSAVDMKTDALIRKAFKEEIPNTTKLIIAQRVSSVQEADLILVMDEGQIVDMGTHDELLKTSSIYQEVYETQMKGGTLEDE